MCWRLGDVTLAEKVFGENHAASVKARESNGWRPTQQISWKKSKTPVWSTGMVASGTQKATKWKTWYASI